MKSVLNAVTALMWFFLAFYLYIYIIRIDRTAAIQELQIRGYENIVLVNHIQAFAWLRTDCKLGQTRYLFTAIHPVFDERETISVCIGWRKTIVDIPSINHIPR